MLVNTLNSALSKQLVWKSVPLKAALIKTIATHLAFVDLLLFVLGSWSAPQSSFYSFVQLEASDALARFYYPPVGAVTISYPESAVREERLVNGKLNGFGQLHPRSQGVVTLGEAPHINTPGPRHI